MKARSEVTRVRNCAVQRKIMALRGIEKKLTCRLTKRNRRMRFEFYSSLKINFPCGKLPSYWQRNIAPILNLQKVKKKKHFVPNNIRTKLAISNQFKIKKIFFFKHAYYRSSFVLLMPLLPLLSVPCSIPLYDETRLI